MMKGVYGEMIYDERSILALFRRMKALGWQKIVSGGRVEFPRTAYNSWRMMLESNNVTFFGLFVFCFAFIFVLFDKIRWRMKTDLQQFCSSSEYDASFSVTE